MISLYTDRESPRFHSCPDNIYVFEDEEVTWKEPTYSDNVGIYYKKCSRMLNGRKFAAGEYNISYTAVDYEYNYAICDFQIISTSRGTVATRSEWTSWLGRILTT